MVGAGSSLQQVIEWDDIMEYFGFETPREAQNKGMQKVADTVGNNGFFVLEGACGTGKTMLALSPLISLVRSNSTKYERIVVVTSVKQQQRAFENDLRKINKQLDDDILPVSGLTLVGKADLNPYIKHGQGITDDEVYEFSERLRENTRSLIDSSGNPKQKADELVRTARSFVSDDDWKTESPDYPYPPIIPTSEDGTEFDPFYAKHISESFKDNEKSTIPYDIETEGLVSPSELIEKAGEKGQSPHSAMSEAMEYSEVIIANYYHIFEPTTVQQLTEDIIGEKTLLIADEAHNLVPKVRELLSEEISAFSISNSRKELQQIQKLLTTNIEEIKKLEGVDLSLDWRKNQFSDSEIETAEKIQSLVNDPDFIAESVDEYVEFAKFVQDSISKVDGISENDLEKYKELLNDILKVTDKKVSEKLNEEYGEYWDPESTDNFKISLRNPEEPKEDSITQYVSLSGKMSTMRKSSLIGNFLEQCFKYLYSEIRESNVQPTVYTKSTSRVLDKWATRDHTSFYRQIEIESRNNEKESASTNFEWEKYFTVSLNLKNCIPSRRLSERIGKFGGGVFMSATLEPIDVFKQVSGIEKLDKNKGRPVIEKRYGLNFPEPNRESLAISSPYFKYENKENKYKTDGSPNKKGVRGTYSEIIETVAKTTQGNVLIVMPSYSEAKWAGKVLESEKTITKTVLVDKSSKDEKTEKLKQKFFNGSPKILVTGALGTLVEGVDYKGEKLRGVLVCGVPLENTREPYKQAIKAAYNERFNEKGFDFAFTIPAVRKARQSIGRVIRTDTDVGVRVLADERYINTERWDSVRKWLPEEEKSEFTHSKPSEVENRLNAFWKYQKTWGELSE